MTQEYHEINEQLAKTAKEMNSFSRYEAGSATEEYRRSVDHARQVAESAKANIGVRLHYKIETLLARYEKKLADWTNKNFRIETMCPSVMISGAGNFPVRKKEKQNAARERHWEEYAKIKYLIEKMDTIGMGGISSDDPDALDQLKEKLAELEAQKYTSAERKRIRDRIQEIEDRENIKDMEFDGGEVLANKDENRLQVFFDERPSKETCYSLKKHGFKWAPSQKAWQRLLNGKSLYAIRSFCKEHELNLRLK